MGLCRWKRGRSSVVDSSFSLLLLFWNLCMFVEVGKRGRVEGSGTAAAVALVVNTWGVLGVGITIIVLRWLTACDWGVHSIWSPTIHRILISFYGPLSESAGDNWIFYYLLYMSWLAGRLLEYCCCCCWRVNEWRLLIYNNNKNNNKSQPRWINNYKPGWLWFYSGIRMRLRNLDLWRW